MMESWKFWLVALASSLQAPPLPTAPVQQEPASIEGRVLDGNTGLPLSNVGISSDGSGYLNPVEIAPGNFLFSDRIGSEIALTDAEGRFVLNGIRPGTVTVSARRSGYMDLRPDGRRIPGNSSGVMLSLAPGEQLKGAVYRIFPAAIVSGKVLDVKGQPVASANVYASRQGYNDLGQLVPKVVNSTQTDDRGEFRFSSLPTGSYTFRFERNGVRFGQSSQFSYYTVYYPGEREFRNAVAVTVEGGTETRLHTVTLPSGRGGMLTIHITREANAGNDTQVVIWRPGEPVDTTYGNFPNPIEGVAGQFPPGTYQIEIETGKSRGYARVDVGEEDARVNVTVPNPATVVGRAGVGDPHDDDHFKPIAGLRLNLLDTIANNSGNRPTLISGADGKFTNPAVKPGLFYVFGVTLPPSMVLVAVRQGNRDVFGETFPIEGGDIDLNLIVSENPGSIRGTVTNKNGNRVPGAVVALMPDDRTQRSLIVSKTADGKGTFELQGAPGAYHLYSWSELDGAAYRNSEFMKAFDSRGTPIQIEKDAKLNADLKLVDE